MAWACAGEQEEDREIHDRDDRQGRHGASRMRRVEPIGDHFGAPLPRSSVRRPAGFRSEAGGFGRGSGGGTEAFARSPRIARESGGDPRGVAGPGLRASRGRAGPGAAEGPSLPPSSGSPPPCRGAVGRDPRGPRSPSTPGFGAACVPSSRAAGRGVIPGSARRSHHHVAERISMICASRSVSVSELGRATSGLLLLIL